MTHVMAKGANIPLTAGAVRAVLRWSATPGAPDVDVSALLVAADGKVRSDADFVFYNQPRHPSGRVRHLPKQQASGGEVSDAVEIDLARLPEGVDRVVLAGSSEGGAFPSVPRLRVLVFDVAAGELADPVAEFAITDSGDVTALVAGEFYRREGSWKFRAVGQGYATGLSGLATDYGIAVEDGDGNAGPGPVEAGAPAGSRPADDDEQDVYTLAPATPAAPPPPQPGTPPTVPPAPQQAPAGYGYPPPAAAGTGAYGYPQAPYPAPVQQPRQPQQGGYGYPQQQPPAGYGYPPPQTGPGYGYPQAQTQPPQYPQPAPHQQAQQAQQPAPNPQPAPQPGATEFALPPQGPQFQPR